MASENLGSGVSANGPSFTPVMSPDIWHLVFDQVRSITLTYIYYTHVSLKSDA